MHRSTRHNNGRVHCCAARHFKDNPRLPLKMYAMLDWRRKRAQPRLKTRALSSCRTPPTARSLAERGRESVYGVSWPRSIYCSPVSVGRCKLEATSEPSKFWMLWLLDGP
ncbi:hypothetical protein VFPPC_03004 [Pochonia chlamydosporia 170]|uniref:Uncharacterized protein n=1 Tax=Pochonia chlamydosporia 170 TaxID=1380566 RepID=A0A179FY48_METCM|nr:hypothetical protein VFPPC_03004 [Pochonia chlamydosporia 170]OAQ70552.1 hypothetical protein VFPPC_03004 [Pochonia chlamydosporia 170]